MRPLSLPLNLASVTTHTDLDVSAALMVQTIKLRFDTSLSVNGYCSTGVYIRATGQAPAAPTLFMAPGPPWAMYDVSLC